MNNESPINDYNERNEDTLQVVTSTAAELVAEQDSIKVDANASRNDIPSSNSTKENDEDASSSSSSTADNSASSSSSASITLDDNEMQALLLECDAEPRATKDRLVEAATKMRTRHEEATDVVAPTLAEVRIMPDGTLTLLGTLKVVSDDFLVIESDLSMTKPLGYGTVVSVKDRSVIGRIMEPFGPVQRPLYVIRYTSLGDLEARCGKLESGLEVFYVAEAAIDVQLDERKPCDASNIFDEEVDEKELDFSDDEEERKEKSRRLVAKRARQAENGGGPAIVEPRAKRRRGRGRGKGEGRPRGDFGRAPPLSASTATSAQPFLNTTHATHSTHALTPTFMAAPHAHAQPQAHPNYTSSMIPIATATHSSFPPLPPSQTRPPQPFNRYAPPAHQQHLSFPLHKTK